MTDDRHSISSSRLAPADVVRQSFATVRRGFDPGEVRAFLDLIARELQGVEAREHDLRKAAHDADERAKHPVLDEATLSAALGEQSAQVLRNAHEEAARIVERAESTAAQMLRQAQQHIAETSLVAEKQIAERVAEAELRASKLEEDSATQAQTMLDRAHADGETLVAHAREQGRAMVEEAQEARRRVLAEMDRRRRIMHVQIEQLRAARDQLGLAIVGVRDAVDRVTADLAHSDDDARLAAAEVARRQPNLNDPVGEAIGEMPVSDATSEEAVPTSDPAAGGIDEAGELRAVDDIFARIRATVGTDDDDNADVAAPVEVAEDVEPLVGDAATMAARDAAMAPVTAALARKVKRALQDDQNDVLERARSSTEPDLSAVLGDDIEQRNRYRDASLSTLAEATVAGVSFGSTFAGSDTASTGDGVVASIAKNLGQTVVAMLRRKLEESDASTDIADAINSAFREWRGQRIDRLVGDAVLTAFNAGVVASAHGAGDLGLRWIVGGEGPTCVDCADNGLSGTVTVGTEFPTGHRYPPVHPGCRCQVVPAAL